MPKNKVIEYKPESGVAPEQPAQSDAAPRIVAPHGRLMPAPGSGLVDCKTSLDLRTPLGKAMLVAAGNPGDVPFGGDGCARITAVHWAVFADEATDPESGEVKLFARTVLFDKMGRTFRTTSAHAPHRLAQVLELYSREEWGRGIPFLIQERMSPKTKRVYHDLRIDMEAVSAAQEQG